MVARTDVSPDEEVIAALEDDLNTPRVLTRLHALTSEIRGPAAGLHQIELKRALKASGMILGVLTMSEGEYFRSHSRRFVIDEAHVKNLVDARSAARKAKNFAESDRIRDELAAMGVVLKDTKEGTTWEVVR
jgi:cysteinyl-tRNA synthetase